jgi:type I restriction enzyme S subunit
VEKIETLFADLDAGVESLTRARARLALYRQSVLKAAFEGRLTADWRAENPDKLEDPETLLARIEKERAARYKQALDDWHEALAAWRTNGEKGKKPAKPKRFPEATGKVNFPEDVHPPKPDAWSWISVGDLAEVTGGLTKNQKRNALRRKAKYLRVANVYSNKLDLDDVQEIGLTEDEYIKTLLKSGDILIVEGNGSVEQIGRMALWRDQLEGVSHQNHLIRARFLSCIDPTFALMFFMSPWGRKLVMKKASSTSGLHTLSISKVSGLPCPVPHISEQREIVTRLEAELSNIDALEAQIDDGLARSKALRQSILKRAFAGKLVPQDPSDEPACALLERIKAEKADAPKMRRRRA